MSKVKSIYGVFIIESLKLRDEANGSLDGKILQQMLDLCRIRCQYFYIRTKKELEEIIQLYAKSKLRYLHLSCHASDTDVRLTFDTLRFHELAEIIGPNLKSRRFFLSACKAVNFDFAKEYIPIHLAYSVIGSPNAIRFDKSALFWSGFYHKMKEIDEEMMLQDDILKCVEILSTALDVKINYYSVIRKGRQYVKNELREYLIRPNQKTESSSLKV